ncbi:1-phosphofructokinase family hexose kinase [Mucilaginibacter daejeonensis]|uniref:1-phosphofructokinase family hexose kinase n=1 Tax=Mucilaginibacter daejeonensis TaxID=398049 RepID=UPI001D17A665|nr:1-phosphofructokinase family hexose kinase [Mucilaginibacter daejeonensis]UEG52683.1 1-phosphofructokinase family hexose kinase [Mucilaginibacter daejeonensis]
MKHIVTVTLSPVVDKSTKVDRIEPDQKLACDEPLFEPGGGGINVSRGLKRLNVNSIAVFPSGGLTGQLLQDLLKAEHINQVPILTEKMTRENFIVVNREVHEEYRFGMPAVELLPKEEREILSTIKKLVPKPKFMVVSGSMPPGASDDFIAKLARVCKEDDIKLIVDTSGEALANAVNEGIYLLKPNQKELSKLTGIEVKDKQSVEAAAQQIIDKGKCQVVVVSLGPDGAYVASRGYSEHIPAPDVEKRSTVGAGDSMVAGMVYALDKGWELKDVVRMGIACGSAATMNAGPELFRKADAESLFEKLK